MSTRTRRSAILTAAATASVLLLAACSSGSSADDGSITYWGAFSSTDTEKYFDEHFIEAFNEASETQVSMEVKQLQNLASLTDTAVSAGRGADVVYTGGPASALRFATAERVDSLDDYATEYGWEDKLLPWALEASRVDGKLYSVPVSYGSVVMFYNPATFEEHGWTVPTTAEEFEDVATEALEAGLIPVGAGNSGYQAQSEWYLTAVLNAAVGPQKLYDTLTGDAEFTDPEYVSAIENFATQIQDGWWGGGANRYFTNTDTDMFTGLANGDVAMYITGTWSFGSADTFFGEAAGNDATWDWAPLPAMSDSVEPGVFPLAIGTTLSVNSVSKNKDGAAEFIDSFISAPEKNFAYLAATGENPPPLQESASSYKGEIDERVMRLYDAIPATSNLGYASWTFFPAATDSYLYTEFDKVITGDLSAEEYLAGLQSTFAKELADGKVIVPFAPAA